MQQPMIKDETMMQLLMLTAAVATVSMASPAVAEVIDVIDNHGGAVAQYDQRWRGLAARGSTCASSDPASRLARSCSPTFPAAGYALRPPRPSDSIRSCAQRCATYHRTAI